MERGYVHLSVLFIIYEITDDTGGLGEGQTPLIVSLVGTGFFTITGKRAFGSVHVSFKYLVCFVIKKWG